MKLFSPVTKVQRDRAIMRETDSRMAKYSRRGLALNLAVYLLCVFLGFADEMAHDLVVVLTVGLLMMTLLRGYIAIRFDHIYAKGPNRWRGMFFAITLLGAAWWSLILCSFTWILGFVAETPILWMYTVIFFATTSHATSPFKLFSQTYQTIALLPPILVALYTPSFDSYMYAMMMLLFLLLLNHQVTSLSESYWGRLESNYELRNKARHLEAEKRDVDASVDLNSEFLFGLGHEFRTSLNEILGGLSLLSESELSEQQKELLQIAVQSGERQLDLVNNIVDFSEISSRNIVLDYSKFNLGSMIEEWLQDLSKDTFQQHVELEPRLAKDLPIRVGGDINRIHHVFRGLISNAAKYSEQGRLAIDIDYVPERDTKGILDITVTDLHSGKGNVPTRTVPETPFQSRSTGLWFSICKGLIECMGGSIEILELKNREICYRVRVPLETVSSGVSPERYLPSGLQGKRILVLQSKLSPGLSCISSAIENLISFDVVYDCQSVTNSLKDPDASSRPYDLIVMDEFEKHPLYQTLSVDLSLAENPIPIIALTPPSSTNNDDRWQKALEASNVYGLPRPIYAKSFCNMVSHVLLGKALEISTDSDEALVQGHKQKVLIVDDQKVNQLVAQAMLNKMGFSTEIAADGVEALEILNESKVDLVLMDCIMPEMDGYEATRRIRAREKQLGSDRHIPIVAMTATVGSDVETHCLGAGMDDYLAKPVRIPELSVKLSRWLDLGGEIEI